MRFLERRVSSYMDRYVSTFVREGQCGETPPLPCAVSRGALYSGLLSRNLM